MARLALVMDRRLPLRRAGDEEPRIEASCFNFRRHPVGEISELVECQAKVFGADDLPECDLPREEVGVDNAASRSTEMAVSGRASSTPASSNSSRSGRDVMGDRCLWRDVGHPCRCLGHSIDGRLEVIDVVAGIDTAARKHMRAAHERDAVAPTHEKHLEGVARPQENNGGRGNGSNDTHRFVISRWRTFRSDPSRHRRQLHAIRLV